MSLNTFSNRVKFTQKIIDAYLGTALELGAHDPFTAIDQLRSYLGYGPIFGDFSGLASQSDLSEYLSGQLKEVGTRSAICGDVTAIFQDGKYSIGICLGHEYSLFAVSGDVFGLIPNKSLTKAWRIGGEH